MQIIGLVREFIHVVGYLSLALMVLGTALVLAIWFANAKS